MQARLEVAVSIPEELADPKPNQARLEVVALIQDDKLEEQVVRIIYDLFENKGLNLVKLVPITRSEKMKKRNLWFVVLLKTKKKR